MLKFLLEKEFKQIFRNPFIPKLILAMPIIIMMVLPWAANQEIKNLKISVIDSDHSALSKRLANKITASGYFRLTDFSASFHNAMQSVDAGKSDIIIEIPFDFENSLFKSEIVSVMISANAVNGLKGGLGSAYLSSIINDFADELSAERGNHYQSSIIRSQFRFNPHLNYKAFIIPALFVMLLTLFTGFLPAFNIVAEKESGTTEQMNVTPVNKGIFIISKLIPYWIIGFVILSICMGIAALVYGLKPAGSLAAIYIYAIIYILVVSGLGIVISNYSSTMQQAMFVMFFFMMTVILLSGLFTPISSMPQWAQTITTINPLKYLMEVMRAIYLKGSGMHELLPQLFALCGFALIFNGWAVLSYKKSK
ncbi:MAG: ABC transporter permease [Prevotellaceae bacterium]|nr:ABC transporter permease [Prevotellaceae bacterium]